MNTIILVLGTLLWALGIIGYIGSGFEDANAHARIALGMVIMYGASTERKFDSLEAKLNGLAKGSPSQGSREQERTASRFEGDKDVLDGHWHKEVRLPLSNTYFPSKDFSGICLHHHDGRCQECPDRDPRSTR